MKKKKRHEHKQLFLRIAELRAPLFSSKAKKTHNLAGVRGIAQTGRLCVLQL